MDVAQWTTVVAAFLGAGVGAGLSYLAALRATGQRETQGRREEWGRRFTTALTDLGDGQPRRRHLGRVLLVRLVSSTLASTEEKALAEALLAAEARYGFDGADLTVLTSGTSLDEITFVEEDDEQEGKGEQS